MFCDFVRIVLVRRTLSKIFLLVIIFQSLAVWAEGAGKIIKLKNDVYYVNLQNTTFSDEYNYSDRTYIREWKAPSFSPIEASSINYDEPWGEDTFTQANTIAVQFNILESYDWLKSKIKSKNKF